MKSVTKLVTNLATKLVAFFNFFLENLAENEKSCLSLHSQIVVRGRELIALAAIFKLELSDPHTRT